MSDLVGGIYGPDASWASTGANALRPAVKAASASARGENEAEVLEYYQYHSDRDSHGYTVRLGRLFYLGSVYPLPGGVSSGADGVGEIPQSFTRAREYFSKVARTMWPKDVDGHGHVVGKRKMSKEMEDHLREPAMVSAGFLGRMALRGEGQRKDYKRARMWYERAAELVSDFSTLSQYSSPNPNPYPFRKCRPRLGMCAVVPSSWFLKLLGTIRLTPDTG